MVSQVLWMRTDSRFNCCHHTTYGLLAAAKIREYRSHWGGIRGNPGTKAGRVDWCKERTAMDAQQAALKAATQLIGSHHDTADRLRVAANLLARPDTYRRYRPVLIDADVRSGLDIHHGLVFPEPSPTQARTLERLRADIDPTQEPRP